MKAIYINLDPYLAAFAAWLKGVTVDPDTGVPDTPPPTFDPLPLAVTIPLGETTAVFLPGVGNVEDEPDVNTAMIDGETVKFVAVADAIPANALAVKVTPGFSTLAPSAKYWVEAVSGDVSASVKIQDEYGNGTTITFTVLVRRETASGPVDLVDFTPPASGGTPSAADIKSALVAAGPGALAGVSLDGMDLSEAHTITCHQDGDSYTIGYYRIGDGDTITELLGYATGS